MFLLCIYIAIYSYKQKSIFSAEHANLPLIPPFLQPGNHEFYDGVNFASAGAGALVETFQGSVCIHKSFVKRAVSLFPYI